jgi:hypothetical protein
MNVHAERHSAAGPPVLLFTRRGLEDLMLLPLARISGRLNWKACAGVVLAAAAWLALECEGNAAVVVISNRTDRVQAVAVQKEGAQRESLQLAPGASRPIFSHTPVSIELIGLTAGKSQSLEPDCAYAIVNPKQGGATRVNMIRLGDAPGRGWPTGAPPITAVAGRTIDVKILVDEDERRPISVWEPALRQRVEAASKVLVAHGGAPLRIVGVATWVSNNLETDFHRTLREFERVVPVAPAQVAIGFSSQYEVVSGRIHLGGTRGAFHSHILLRERIAHVQDTERLEVLTHELGHWMGATHSAEKTSVMRPVVGQGQLRAAGTAIEFDAPNTLLLSLMGEEIRARGVRSLADVSPDTQRRMAQIYAALNPRLPKDPASGHYLALLNSAKIDGLLKDTREILAQIKNAAVHRPVDPGVDVIEASLGGGGDQLLEHYVRQAARAAQRMGPENGPRAFVLAMGLALDDGQTLRRLPLAGDVLNEVEGEAERRERLAVMGAPTMRGRPDLAKHFFVSAHLVALTGSEMARSAGLAKEMLDANGGTGFSFRDMAANRAGIVFAHAVLSRQMSLEQIARDFTVNAFMPPVEDLRESLQVAEFLQAYGGAADQRLADELARIEVRINALRVYSGANSGAAAGQ